ncbi:MAG: GTP-binding protein, partial [Hallerella sp.]|nr:GTP-binding protein [Hallerella sp.]
VSYCIDSLREDVKQVYLADNPEVKKNWDSRFGDRENQVVFIGKDYNKNEIIVELEKCLDERAIA